MDIFSARSKFLQAFWAFCPARTSLIGFFPAMVVSLDFGQYSSFLVFCQSFLWFLRTNRKVIQTTPSTWKRAGEVRLMASSEIMEAVKEGENLINDSKR